MKFIWFVLILRIWHFWGIRWKHCFNTFRLPRKRVKDSVPCACCLRYMFQHTTCEASKSNVCFILHPWLSDRIYYGMQIFEIFRRKQVWFFTLGNIQTLIFVLIMILNQTWKCHVYNHKEQLGLNWMTWPDF